MGFEPTTPLNNANELNAEAFASRMEEIRGMLQNHILLAQANHEKYTNRHRGTAPQYRKENCRAGPYPVKKVISTHAVELLLSGDIRVYPVFHVNLLKPAATDAPHAGHIQLPPPIIKVDGETEWEVNAIIDSPYHGYTKKLQYRVQWTGYDELSWEDSANITNAANLLNDYNTRYPGKPGPRAACDLAAA